MTPEEISVLETFSELPFQCILRKPSQELPASPEDPSEARSQVLLCLEKKGLIDIDCHQPLKGFDYSPWPGFLHGSMALTARGQEILDTLTIQGAQSE
jgi:hypothetical protein